MGVTSLPTTPLPQLPTGSGASIRIIMRMHPSVKPGNSLLQFAGRILHTAPGHGDRLVTALNPSLSALFLGRQQPLLTRLFCGHVLLLRWAVSQILFSERSAMLPASTVRLCRSGLHQLNHAGALHAMEHIQLSEQLSRFVLSYSLPWRETESSLSQEDLQSDATAAAAATSGCLQLSAALSTSHPSISRPSAS